MSRRTKVKIIVGVVLLIIIAILIFWFNSSDQATINNSTTTSQKQTPVAPKTFNDAYITFQYSGSYIFQQLAITQPDLDNVMLRADTSYPKQLAVSVTSGDDTADSSYTYRKSEPSLYTYKSITVDNLPATLWVKNDDTEQTIYIQNGNKYAVLSFSLQAQLTGDELTPEVNSVLASFHWK